MRSVELTQKEVEVLKNCIYMSIQEGLYLFDRNNLDASEKDIEEILRKFGMTDMQIQQFMKEANSM